ncbi:MAG: hydrogenase maturation protease [Myxococcales bacterium]|nr:hydrogenase maturation protease [Myxococcales bacterium]
MAVRVIGLGQRAAGDDGVGLCVLDALAANPPNGAELHPVGDPARLVELLQGADRVVLVDAAVGAGPAGGVLALGLAELAEAPLSPVSTHGIGVRQALELARVLAGGALPEVVLLAVAIEPPSGYATELSGPVAAAVPVAAAKVRELLAK